MKTRLICLMAILVYTGAPALADADSPWLTRLDEAVTAAEAGDRYIVVDLYADWCGWCKVLEREVFPSPEFRELTRDMVLLKVDTEDGGEGTELQARFGAYSLPTTLILDPDLVKIGEVKGYAPAPRFVALVRRQLDEHAALLDVYDKALASGDSGMMRRLAEDLHGRGDGRRAARLYEAVLAKIPRGEAAAWLYYFQADAHRLAGELPKAAGAIEQARRLTKDFQDPELIERLDMLEYYVAHDRGDCDAAVASLETFLARHPRSDLRSQARLTLAALRRGEGMQCT